MNNSPQQPIMYAIRRTTDGLFSRGGMMPRFGRRPKLWTKATLTSHLAQFTSVNRRTKERVANERSRYYANCEVVQFNLYEQPYPDMTKTATTYWDMIQEETIR